MGIKDDWQALFEENKASVNEVDGSTQLDCNECRFIGTAAFSGATIYTAWSTYSKDMKNARRSFKIRFYSFGTCLSLTFFTLAVCRAFNLSMFNSKNRGKTPLDIFKEDLNWFKRRNIFTKD